MLHGGDGRGSVIHPHLLSSSPTCIAQSIMFYFFMILAEYWMMVMAMSLSQLAFSQSGQADPLTTFVNKLFKKDKVLL